ASREAGFLPCYFASIELSLVSEDYTNTT
ncbi:MAG: hypothetical protein JWQ24_2125, partial [Tardiphaga sp.]|nr:hypothetical protein [Tardiphaga sp.]